MVSKTVIVFSILAVLVSYAMYDEFVPPGSAEPVKLKLLLALGRHLDTLLQTLDKYGLVNYLEARRFTMKLAMNPMNRATEGVETEDVLLDGVPVRVYRPTGWAERPAGPAMAYYHGGGWTLCDPDTHEALTAHFAKEVNMLVVSVDYRLNPEHSQLDGLNDCVTATKYLISNSRQFNVDPNRVVVAGDSAGGNYAAAASLKLRDERFQPMPKIQLLLYPAVQSIDLRLPSYQQNGDGPFLTTHDLFWFKTMVCFKDNRGYPHFNAHTHVPDDVLASLAKDVLNHDQLPAENKFAPYKPHDYKIGASTEVWDQLKHMFMDPYHNPLMADTHTDLPEAYIFTCQYDMIRDEGYMYAEALRKAGVKVTHYNSPIGWHGMLNMVKDLKDSRDEMDRMCSYLKERL